MLHYPDHPQNEVLIPTVAGSVAMKWCLLISLFWNFLIKCFIQSCASSWYSLLTVPSPCEGVKVWPFNLTQVNTEELSKSRAVCRVDVDSLIHRNCIALQLNFSLYPSLIPCPYFRRCSSPGCSNRYPSTCRNWFEENDKGHLLRQEIPSFQNTEYSKEMAFSLEGV